MEREDITKVEGQNLEKTAKNCVNFESYKRGNRMFKEGKEVLVRPTQAFQRWFKVRRTIQNNKIS